MSNVYDDRYNNTYFVINHYNQLICNLTDLNSAKSDLWTPSRKEKEQKRKPSAQISNPLEREVLICMFME